MLNGRALAVAELGARSLDALNRITVDQCMKHGLHPTEILEVVAYQFADAFGHFAAHIQNSDHRSMMIRSYEDHVRSWLEHPRCNHIHPHKGNGHG